MSLKYEPASEPVSADVQGVQVQKGRGGAPDVSPHALGDFDNIPCTYTWASRCGSLEPLSTFHALLLEPRAHGLCRRPGCPGTRGADPYSIGSSNPPRSWHPKTPVLASLDPNPLASEYGTYKTVKARSWPSLDLFRAWGWLDLVLMASADVQGVQVQSELPWRKAGPQKSFR